ncbi:MAG: class I SAM-dependent methyltransferase [Opitutaceae bacterium]
MSFWSSLSARFYDATMRGLERSCLAQWRPELIGDLRGEVLEIGSGTGANLAYYSDKVSRLVLAEPDRFMRKQLLRKVDRLGRGSFSVVDCVAESMPFETGTFDVVVATLVLCSVRSQKAALAEIRRLLKPGGSLVFLEHVTAGEPHRLARWQRWIQPVWVQVCGNCHLTRDTEKAILDSGFEFVQIDRGRLRGAPAIVSPMIKGKARRGS